MMRSHAVFAAIVAPCLLVYPAFALDIVAQPLTVEDIVAMQARLPEESHPNGKPAGYEHVGQARKIAEVVAAHTTSLTLASLAVTYAAFESGNQPGAKGDKDKLTGVPQSYGAWQLNIRRARPEVAMNPDRAIDIWFDLVNKAWEKCGHNPIAEKLALVASGNCDHGRRKAAVRDRIAETIRAAVDPTSDLAKE